MVRVNGRVIRSHRNAPGCIDSGSTQGRALQSRLVSSTERRGKRRRDGFSVVDGAPGEMTESERVELLLALALYVKES